MDSILEPDLVRVFPRRLYEYFDRMIQIRDPLPVFKINNKDYIMVELVHDYNSELSREINPYTKNETWKAMYLDELVITVTFHRLYTAKEWALHLHYVTQDIESRRQ